MSTSTIQMRCARTPHRMYQKFLDEFLTNL
nr:MAG TPA: hypothetical protein [Caudoviricetes sp.]